MGVELLNDDSAMADAEIIAMTVKVMLDAGLTDFQISIGHVGFFQALAEEAALSEDVLNELKELISIKNHFGAEELLAKQNLRSDLFEALRDVPQCRDSRKGKRPYKKSGGKRGTRSSGYDL